MAVATAAAAAAAPAAVRAAADVAAAHGAARAAVAVAAAVVRVGAARGAAAARAAAVPAGAMAAWARLPSTATSRRPPPTRRCWRLAAWDLARTREQLPDTPRGQVMTLRTHKRLIDEFEGERNIPEADRSYLRVREDAAGSVLLIHGVSTRPGDLHMLAGRLYDANFNVYVIRLPDYGRPHHTISEVSWEAALKQVRQRFRLLARGGGKVHVVGLGFGATLAIHLAVQEKVSSLVLLSPAVMPRESFFQRLVVRLKLHRVGALQRWVGWNADVMEGMDAARGHIPGLKVPIYGAQCEDDDRASPESVRILQRKTRHDDSLFRIFPTGGHAILTTHGEEVLYRDILDFCSGH